MADTLGDDVELPVQLALDLPGGQLGLPRNVQPTLAQATPAPFDSPDYLFEVRWDCIRAIALVEAGRVILRNPQLGEIQVCFPELAGMDRCIKELPAILDGEIVLVDERGRPDFDGLRSRLRAQARPSSSPHTRPACYLAYDLLMRGSRSLMDEPLVRRKRLLDETVQRDDCIYVSESFDTEGVALFDAVAESELEGIVAKAKASAYHAGLRNPGWLAVKRPRRSEFVVAGCSAHILAGRGDTRLLLGAYDPFGSLTYAGSVAAPAEDDARLGLFTLLNALQADQSPFPVPPRALATWVRPEVVVTVAFQEWEPGGKLRGATLERARLDISPSECLLPVTPAPAGSSRPTAIRQRPSLTLLSTLPLPLPRDAPAGRPSLRLVDDGH
ncbi:MAG TPA: hypothetical protein VMV93_06465 [Chloroflexota bacterium]|nr:hypothetical protein [Chloroflexota bacterium]